jgi:hypothetical protein
MVACKNKAFAGVAFYAVPNRGNGPSIRFAEEVARVFGNFQYGHRELSRDEGKSEVEVFAWDVEKNNRSIRQLTVMHVVDTKNGPKPCRDQADIDNKIANVASKQVRGRILALMPKWLVEDAIQECRKTLAGNNTEPLEVRVRRMIGAFSEKFGVNAQMLEGYMKKKLEVFTVDDLVDLQGVFNALKEGGKVNDYFGAEVVDAAEAATATDAVLAAGKKLAATQATPAATPAQEPAKAAAATQAPAQAAAPAQEAATPAAEPAAAPPPPPAARARAKATPSPAPAAPTPAPAQAQAEPEPQSDNAGGPPETDDPGPGPTDFF